MGNLQAVPAIGEVATVVEGAGKTAAAGCCTIVGNTKAASELLDSAGHAFVNYSEVNCIAANVRMVVAKLKKDNRKVSRLYKKQAEAWDGLINSTPLVGHAKGIIHFIMGDHKKGEECMISASRTTAVIGAIAFTKWAGAVVCGAAAVGAGVMADGATTGIYSLVKREYQPAGLIAAVTNAVESGGNAVDVFNCVAIPAGDFVAGAIGGRAAKGVKRSLGAAAAVEEANHRGGVARNGRKGRKGLRRGGGKLAKVKAATRKGAKTVGKMAKCVGEGACIGAGVVGGGVGFIVVAPLAIVRLRKKVKTKAKTLKMLLARVILMVKMAALVLVIAVIAYKYRSIDLTRFLRISGKI